MAATAQDLLEVYRGAGRLDSSGRFTLRLEKALPRLRDYGLPGVHLYPLKLVQAAVAAGARHIRAEIDAFGVRLEHDGDPPRGREIEQLFGYLLDGRGLPELAGLRHLAAGSPPATATGARRIELATGKGDLGVWEPGRSVRLLERKADLSPFSTCFSLQWHIEQVASGWWRQARTGLSRLCGRERSPFLEDEARAIHQSCQFCPLTLELNGQPVNRWKEPASCLAADYVIGGRLCPPATSRATMPPRVPRSLLRDGSPVPCRSVLWLTGGTGAARVSFVLDGVVGATRELDLGVPGLVAVVDAGELKSDLTGLAVVEDERFQNLVTELTIRARHLAHRLRTRKPSS